jgi:cytochrome P450
MTVTVAFDPFEAGFVQSPYEQYARLRAEDPVHRSELLEGWVLTRHDDVASVLRDPSVSVELDNAASTPLVEAQRERLRQRGEADRMAQSLVLRDDPDHNRLRRLLARPFGPRPVERLRTIVTQRVDAALVRLALPGEPGAMDVIADFAYPLPVGVFCEVLGVPDGDAERVRTWIAAVAHSLDPVLDAAERERCLALTDEMKAYLEGQIARKRRAPADDVLTVLVHAEEDGDRLSPDELVAQLVTLYVAGHEPTTAVIGSGLLALLAHPDQLDRLRAEPGLTGHGVHELLRYDGPNQFVRRIAVEPMTIAGRTIAPGDVLYPCIGAANRDPERWDEPDRVRVDRPDAARHLQFGAGIHACLGAHLARLQAEVALGALVTRLDDIALAGPPTWNDRMVLRGPQALPITFTAAEPPTPRPPGPRSGRRSTGRPDRPARTTG